MKLTENKVNEIKAPSHKKAITARYFIYPLTDLLNEIIARELESGKFGSFGAEPDSIEYMGESFPAIEVPKLFGISISKNELAKDSKFLVTYDDKQSFEKWNPKGERDGT